MCSFFIIKMKKKMKKNAAAIVLSIAKPLEEGFCLFE